MEALAPPPLTAHRSVMRKPSHNTPTVDLDRQRPTDAELDAAAQIRPEDIQRAVELWDLYSGMPGLLDAVPEGDEATNLDGQAAA
jgi:hypothetical protein